MEENFEVKEEAETVEELAAENFDKLATRFDPNDIDAPEVTSEVVQ